MGSHESIEHEAKHSPVEQFQLGKEYERSLQTWVQDHARKNMRMGEVPSWMVKAFLLTRLFQIGTAVASEMENEVNVGEIPFAEQVRTDVELPQETRDALEAYSAHDAKFIMTVQTRDGEVVQGIVFPEELLGDHPRVIEGTVVRFSISSSVSSEEFSTICNNFAQAKGSSVNTVLQKKYLTFEFGDREAQYTVKTKIFPVGERETGHVSYIREDLMYETGSVHKAHRDEAVAFGFSFDFIGGPEVQDLFYHDPLPLRGDVQGVPVSWSGIDHQRGEQILASNRANIESGMNTVREQFGPEILENTISHVMFIDRNEENAYALWQGLFLEEDLILGVERGMLTSKNIEEIVEHELYHLIDYRYGLSQELESVFLSSDPSVLATFSESSFSHGGYGGHAQDNRQELFVSVMNSLDDPNWEESVRALPADAREVYLASLRAISAKVQARDLEFSSGSLLQELPKRIAFVETVSRHP